MREIKFRVWNKVTKTMHYPDWDELAQRAKLPEMVLMQYTGLKDKNGKEIYEGDIIYSHYAQTASEVYWQGEDLPVGFDLREIQRSEESKNIEYRQDKYWWDIEVIGNIYENPELVTVKESVSNV